MKKFFTRFFVTLGFSTFLMIAGFIALKVFHQIEGPVIVENTVLTLDLNDNFPEVDQESPIRQLLSHKPTTSFFHLLYALSAAEMDLRIKGIALRIDTHHLGLAQLEELRDALLSFRKTGKFIHVFAHSFGDLSPGTATYYIASCADKIWMQPISMLTLTGIQADMPFFGKLIQKLGIDPQILTRKEYKNAYAPFTDERATPANLEATALLLQRLYTKMMDDIKIGREIPDQVLNDLLRTTPILTDQEALKHHLIDHLGYIDQFKNAVLKAAISKDPQSPKPALLSIHHYANDLIEDLPHQSEKIALIYAVGNITSHADHSGIMGGGDSLGAEETRHNFEDALKDPQIKAIVLRIDSPGGSGVASETIRRQVMIAHEKGVPVVASLGNLAASGGYWFAAPCKKILAKQMTITGSIGVIGGKVVFKRLLEDHDINISSVAVGPHGELWSPLSPYSPDSLAILNRSMDGWYARFLQVVAEGRHLTLEHVGEIAKGRVWSGIDAKQYGLIDAFGGLRDAFDVAQVLGGIKEKNTYEIVEYPKAPGLLEAVKKSFDGSSELSLLWKNLYVFWRDISLSLKGETRLYAPAPQIRG